MMRNANKSANAFNAEIDLNARIFRKWAMNVGANKIVLATTTIKKDRNGWSAINALIA
jgi:hypothetical protein